MSRRRAEPETPPCYALVHAGLEAVAADEIEHALGGEVKKTARGIVVFRAEDVDQSVLKLRTTEDVFLFGWGSDELTYRAEDLDKIRRWTAHEVNWDRLLQIHHSVRPKPKGKPTYRLVTQMDGKHGYRRADAAKALARGLAGKLPATWRPAEENAAVEIWLTIQGTQAVCGLRLSDKSMRHRTYKQEHLPASLRPTVAAAMVRLADVRPGQVLLDPMCGTGTVLAECAAVHHRRVQTWGGDKEAAAVRAAAANLARFGPPRLARWDAGRLPLPEESVDRVVCNPPFGKQMSRPDEVGALYRRLVGDADRVLRPMGSAVLLVSDLRALQNAARGVSWKQEQVFSVRILGQPAAISVWRKPGR